MPSNKKISFLPYLITYLCTFLYPIASIIIVKIIGMKNKAESDLIFAGFVIIIALTLFSFYYLFYKNWQTIIKLSKKHNLAPSISTPAKAVGYLFIPFYNLYWIFKAYPQLLKDFNNIAQKSNFHKQIPIWLGYLLSICNILGLVPWLSILFFLIRLYIVNPIYIIFITIQINNLTNYVSSTTIKSNN